MLDTLAPPTDRARLTAAAHAPYPSQRPAAAGWRAVLRLLWRWRLRAMALLVALAALWYGAVPLVLGPVVPATAALRAEFLQSVVASGHVEAPYRINIGSQITGIVADVPVAEGQAVKAGDTLVVLDDREARTAVIQEEGAVAQAEARLRQMREVTLPSAEEALRQARATLINAQQGHDRAAKLAESGYGTRVTLDDAVKTLDIARAQARNAELQVFTSRPGGSDYVLAETQLNQARAGLATAQSRLAYTLIVAPRDGLLIARDVERGNVVQPATVLMKLSPTGDTQLVVQIDEKNLGLVAVGFGIRRCLSCRNLRGRSRIHHPRHRPATRLGGGEAAGARPARLLAAGHDRLRGYRSCPASRRVDRAGCQPARTGRRQAVGDDGRGRARGPTAGAAGHR